METPLSVSLTLKVPGDDGRNVARSGNARRSVVRGTYRGIALRMNAESLRKVVPRKEHAP